MMIYGYVDRHTLPSRYDSKVNKAAFHSKRVKYSKNCTSGVTVTSVVLTEV